MNDTNITVVFPSFVYHKKWNKSEEFNRRLHELVARDNLQFRVTNNEELASIGQKEVAYSHVRHNNLLEIKDPVITELTQMADFAIRDYLLSIYNYAYNGDIAMMGDSFYCRTDHHENVGVSTHTHIKADLVVTYYPRIDLNPDRPNPQLRSGALRFYDPSGVGKRFWPNMNTGFHVEQWLQIQPEVGSMLVFEGHLPHDSMPFDGQERLCISILCDVMTPIQHCKVPVTKIMEFQNS